MLRKLFEYYVPPFMVMALGSLLFILGCGGEIRFLDDPFSITIPGRQGRLAVSGAGVLIFFGALRWLHIAWSRRSTRGAGDTCVAISQLGASGQDWGTAKDVAIARFKKDHTEYDWDQSGDVTEQEWQADNGHGVLTLEVTTTDCLRGAEVYGIPTTVAVYKLVIDRAGDIYESELTWLK